MELEDIHVIILLATVVVILFADHEGLSYVRQKKMVLSKKIITVTHRLVWAGLAGMIASGALLVATEEAEVLRETAFYIKMGFVLTLVINGFFIGTLSHVATETPYALLSQKEKTKLMVSGALSTMGWVGAAIIGLFFL
jgi:hypothetical protein